MTTLALTNTNPTQIHVHVANEIKSCIISLLSIYNYNIRVL
jgi:hypothetical protein